jgi:predicted nucleic acid-binding protein
MYLLDTNVLSASRRPEKAAPGFAAWVAESDPREMYLSAVSLLEFRVGALRVARRDGPQASILDRWIREQVLQRFEGRILPFDGDVALLCAPLHVPDPRPERDAMIAATALHHGMVLVTRNTRDFASIGVPLLNPWDHASA